MTDPGLSARIRPRDAFLRLTVFRGALVTLLLLCGLTAWPPEVTSPETPVDLTELPLEALMNLDVPKVYAASKIEQKTTEAPSAVTIVTSDEIKKYGYRTLADVLRSVPG